MVNIKIIQNTLLLPRMGLGRSLWLTSPSVGDNLFAVVPSGRDRALEQSAGMIRLGLQVLAQWSAHQEPAKKRQHMAVINYRFESKKITWGTDFGSPDNGRVIGRHNKNMLIYLFAIAVTFHGNRIFTSSRHIGLSYLLSSAEPHIVIPTARFLLILNRSTHAHSHFPTIWHASRNCSWLYMRTNGAHMPCMYYSKTPLRWGLTVEAKD